jgi:DNA-binding HxlR family transcriptional regulator
MVNFRQLLDQITDKWSILILAALCHEPLRFNAVKRQLASITQEALTQSLRRPERNGLVTRHVMSGPPVAVEYEITPLGRTLEPALLALHALSIDHLSEVEQAWLKFDARMKG